MSHKRHGRKKPYTEIGIRRLPCYRCGKPARFQWNACADGNLWRPLCTECDIGLNRMALIFMKDPLRFNKVRNYRKNLRQT